MSKIKGYVTIVVRDAKTGDIKRTIDDTNYFTEYGSRQRFDGYEHQSDTHLIYNAAASNIFRREPYDMWVSPTTISKNFPVMGETTVLSSRVVGTFPVITTTDGNPIILEWVSRFGQPGSTRTINTIWIETREPGFTQAYAMVSLDVPCIQTTSEILDITYRWVLPYGEDDIAVGGHAVTKGASRLQSRQFASIENGTYPRQERLSAFPAPPPTYFNMYDYLMYDSLTQIATASYQDSTRSSKFRRWRHDVTYTTSTAQGTLAASSNMGSGVKTVFVQPFYADDFGNFPIQTIHNHSATAPHPFLDVDTLATSVGLLTADGSGWQAANTDAVPELFRIEYHTSGDINTARYSFRKCKTYGYTGLNYSTDIVSIPYNHYLGNITNHHGITAFKEFAEYDMSTWVQYDATGITVLKFTNGDVVCLDATTTPALPVTDLRNVSVDSAKNIWVSCFATGLYKITDIWGTPVVTQYDAGTFGFVNDNCYGVSAGYNDRIWAIFDGGLYHSDNSGAVWTVSNSGTSPAFDLTGYTDGNWGITLEIVADSDSPDHQLAIITTSDGHATQRPIWWSETHAASFGTALISSTSRHHRQTRVSKYGNAWAYICENWSSSPRLLTFGSTTTKVLHFTGGVNENHSYSGTNFMYDYYRTPHTMIGRGDTYSGSYNFVHKQGQNVATPSGDNLQSLVNVNNGINTGTGYVPETDGGNGIMVVHTNPFPTTAPDGRGLDSIVSKYQGITQIQSRTNNDYLNAHHTVFEETLWHKYHWNGSAWERNYYADAVDTSGNANTGTRHNFDTESHFFTGRSLVDISSSLSASVFGGDITIAATITSELKVDTNTSKSGEKGQEPGQVIFDASNATSDLTVFVNSGEATPRIAIYENGAIQYFGNSPAYSVEYRFVLTITGTTAKVYIDGVQLGSDITVAVVDLANLAADFYAYVGAQVYVKEYKQNFTPKPYEFIRGNVTNFQMWNVAWDATDVTNDMLDITAVIASKPGANLITRLELTQSLAGLETKLTHTASEILTNGVALGFGNTVGGDIFNAVATDYYTFGVVDGILKDNAISLNRVTTTYASPVDVNFSEFVAAGTASNIIPATASAMVVDPNPAFHRDNASVYSLRGQIAAYTGSGWAPGSKSLKTIINDGYVEFQAGRSNSTVMAGLSLTASTSNHFANHRYLIYLIDTDIQIYEDNVSLGSFGTQTDVDDFYRVERVAGVVSYYKVVAGTPNLLHTSAINTANGTPLFAAVSIPSSGHGIRNITMKLERPANYMDIGNVTNETGSFHPDFLLVAPERPGVASKIFLDGVEALILDMTTLQQGDVTIPVPNAGEVVINYLGGYVITNPADAGKAMTGFVSVVRTD